jgi:hypothetical protein
VTRVHAARVRRPRSHRAPCRASRCGKISQQQVGSQVAPCQATPDKIRDNRSDRSPPTRTRRVLSGRHAAADGLRRIISSLAGAGCVLHGRCELDTSFCSNDPLGRPQLHSPSLACRVFLIKKPFSSKTSERVRRSCRRAGALSLSAVRARRRRSLPTQSSTDFEARTLPYLTSPSEGANVAAIGCAPEGLSARYRPTASRGAARRWRSRR